MKKPLLTLGLFIFVCTTLIKAQAPTFSYYPTCIVAGDTVEFRTFPRSSNYLWNFGDPFSGTLDTSTALRYVAHIYANPGTYTVTLQIDSNNTIYNLSQTFTVISASINASSTTVCSGDPVTLASSGGGSYQWSTGATTSSITVNPLVTTTYGLTVTNNVPGCFANSNQLITVNPQVVLSPASAAICPGGSATFTASGAASYVWSNGGTSSSITVSPSSNTTYSVTATGNSCSAVASAVVTVGASLAVSISPANATICVGGSTTLTAIAGNSYSWSNGATTQTINVSPASATSYSVTVSDGGTCSGTAAANVGINSTPVAAIEPAADTVCVGGYRNLTATGGATYAWSFGPTSAQVRVYPTATTTYSVTVTSAAGCSATASRTVITPDSIVALITPTQTTVCSGANLNLIASGGGVYVWSTGQFGSTINVTATGTTVYTVTVTTAAGCTSTFSSTVDVNPSPPVSINATNTTICSGQSTTLTASGGVSYAWNTDATSAAITVTPTALSVYTVTATGSNGCQSATDVRITVNPTPAAAINPASSAVCLGQKATLSASGGSSYIWSTGATTNSISVQPTVQTSYSITATNASGCSATAGAVLAVSALPVPSINPSSITACSGAPTTLIGQGGASYVWSNGGNTEAITVSPLANTTYTVTVTGTNGCTASTNSTVTTKADPVVTISPGNTAICRGNSVILTATGGGGGGSYLWNTGNPTASITENPTNTTTYTVSVTGKNGCVTVDTAVVTVGATLTPVIAPATPAICLGDSVTLTASFGVSYSWNNGATTQSIKVSPASATSYNVTVTNGTGCSGTATTNVAVNSIPAASISPSSDSICAGQSATLTANGGTSYSWSNASTATAITVTPQTTASYTVTATNSAGCTATSSASVTVNAVPSVSITPPAVTFCSGSSAVLTSSVTGVTGNVSYSWNDNSTTSSITANPAVSSVYTLTVTSAGGCSASAASTVTVNPSPTATLSPSGAVNLCSGASLTLSASGGNIYTWSAGGAQGASLTVSPTSNTTYTVTVSSTNDGTCVATASVAVTVIPAPTVSISPASPTICSGTPVVLTASGTGVSDSWSTGGTTPSITIAPTDTATYTVTTTGSNGCTASGSVTVFVNPGPAAIVTPANAAICVGNSISITASSPVQGTTYAWSTAANSASISVSPTVTTAYVVTATAPNNCSMTVTSLVIADSALVPAIAPSNPTICAGQVVTLTATAATTYAWSSGATTENISVSPIASTTYTLTATNSAGCTGTAEVAVNVNPAVHASISPDGLQICNGSSATLTASGGTSYTWSTGNDSAAITVNGKSHFYSVTVSDITGCSSTASVQVVVRGNPGVNIIADTNTICAGASTNLNAVGGGGGGGPVSYVWSTGSMATTIAVSPITTSLYAVTVTNDVTGCTAAASQTVSVTAAPVVAITPASVTICSGNSATLTASGGTNTNSYNWNNGAAGAVLNVTPGVSTSYTVTVTGSNGCTALAGRTVTVNATPTPSITPPAQTVCAGVGAQLTASGGSTYSWSNGGSGNIIAVSPANTTTYSVTATTAAGCSATTSSTVTVDNVTAVIAPAVTALCAGQSDTLVATGGSSYVWSTGSTTSSIVVTPGNNATYSVTATGGSNCSASATASIIVNLTLTPVITPSFPTICNGSVTTLSASYGNTYHWSNNATSQNIVVAPGSTTRYSVTVTSGVGCSGTAGATVNVNPIPAVSITPATPAVCFGQSTALTVSGGVSYAWSTGSTSTSITVSPATSSSYSVTVTGANSCSAVATRNVTVNALPNAKIAPATSTICAGTTTLLTASGGTTYLWSNGATTAPVSVTPATNTTYTVTVTTAAGCSATTSRLVTLSTPVAAVTPSAQTLCGGQHISLTATGGRGVGGYEWNTGATTASISVTPLSNTTYSVTTTNSNGCTASASSSITVNPAVATISPATDTVCHGISTVLTASAGSSYSWNDGAHANTTTVTPRATTNYTITITNTDGCTATATRTVVVIPTPALSTTPDLDTICGGTVVPVTAVGVGTFNWSTGATTQTINVKPVTSTNYSVTMTAANGCTATSTSIIIARPSAAAVNPAISALCTGQSDTLVASGGLSYLWSTGSTATSIIVTPVTTTTYTVSITTSNGCTNVDTAVVNVNTNLQPVITPSNPAICPGGNVTLVVTAGTSYLWSNGLTSQSITVSPETATSYSVTVNNGVGCSGTATTTVTVNSLPQAAVTPANDSICSGFSAQLTASGGVTYVWNNTDLGAVISVTPTTTTSYTVTVTDANNCSATASGTVTVLNNASAAINPAAVTICSGQSTTLSASGGLTYSWSNASTTSSITVSPLVTTTYTVTASIDFCSASASTVVTVNGSAASASITINSNPICSGQSDTLTATGGVNYMWSSGSDSATAIVTPDITTTYTVTATDINGCSATATASLTVNASPDAVITPAAVSLCGGGETTLVASGGGTYSWGGVNSTSPSVNVNPTVTTVYTVTVTGGNNCASVASATVTVNTPPTILINPSSPSVCSGSNLTLSAVGGVSYAWSNSGTTNSITVSPTSATTYSVTGTDGNGCTGAASVNVTVNQSPVASVSPTSSTICGGTPVTITASGGGNYDWSTNATTAAITDTPATSAVYTVTVTDPVTNCTASASSSITVNTVNATVNPALSSICTGSNQTITATGGGTYLWSNASTAASITVTPATTTTYTVTVTGTNDCSVTLSSTVNVNGSLVPVITPANPTICAGSTVQLSVTAGTTYTWSDAETTQAISVTPLTTTSYQVTVNDNGGCSGTASVNVTVNSVPVAAITPPSATLCSGQSDTLTASGGVSYAWSNASDTSVITITPAITTTYTVTVTNSNNCTATASSVITVNQIPAASIAPALDTICSGQAVTLTASGGSTYSWSNNSTTQSITDNPGGNTSYTVTVTNAGCSATASALVTVNLQPTAAITPDTITVCAGGSGVFTAFDSTGVGTSFNWSNGDNTNSISVNPASTTTYTVTISSANCSATANGYFIVDDVPAAAITPSPASVCAGQGITLTASGGSTYAWNTGDNTASITDTPTSTTTYTVTVYSSSGCSATASVSVTVNTPPVASVDPTSQQICSGTSAVFTASGGVNYNWSDGSTTESVTETPQATTVYIVTVTDNNGCTATASGTANVYSITASINPGSSTTCAGQSQTLTASGGSTYVWSTGDQTAAVTVTPQSTTTYIVTATDTSGCTATASAIVNVNSAPNAAVDPAVSSICTGQSVTLTASGGVSYAWSNTATTDTTTVTPETTTTYSVTVTDANSCTATASAIVNANTTLQPVITPANPAVCPGGSVTLSVTGGTSYAWSTGDVTQTTIVSPTTATVYDVTVSNGPNCSGTASVNVVVNSNPVVAFEPASSLTSCSGSPITVTASGGVSYAWSTGDDVAAVSVTQSNDTSYSVTITDANGCTASGTVQIATLPLSDTVINVSVCAGSTYTFNNQQLTQTGTYTDTIQNGGANGCDSIVYLNLQFIKYLTDSINASFCLGSSYNFNDVILDSAGYYTDTVTSTGGCDSIIILNLTELTPGITIKVSFCPDTGYTYNDTTFYTGGNYFDTLTNINGCDSVIELELDPVSSPSITWLSTNDTTICNQSLAPFVTFPTASTAGGVYSGAGVSNDTLTIDTALLDTTGSQTFIVTYTLQGQTSCPGVAIDTIVVSTCTAVNPVSLDHSLELYPNPANEILTVQSQFFTAQNAAPVVYDLSGKAVSITYSRNADKFTFNTQSLSAGVYFVRVNVQGTIVSRKFIKID